MNPQSDKSIVSILGLTQVIAFFVVSFSVPTIFNSYHRYLELFSHFRFQYFVFSLLCTVLFLIYKNYKSAALMALVFSLNSIYVLPWYVNLEEGRGDNAVSSLKIIHSNVNTANESYKKVIALIKEENPDIVLLQEASALWVNQLASIEKTYPYKKANPRADNFGIAIFSKYPFESIEEIYSGVVDIPSLKVDLMLGGQKITLISTHPVPPISADFYHFRNAQLKQIAAIVKTIQNPVILIGDLNVSMWSSDYDELEKTTALVNARKGFGILPTWPTMLPIAMIPIDHCLLSSEFKVDNIKLGKDIDSDHLPLVLTLSLNLIRKRDF